MRKSRRKRKVGEKRRKGREEGQKRWMKRRVRREWEEWDTP